MAIIKRLIITNVIKDVERNFPGGPVVKTSPSNVGSAGSIPGWGAKIPHALRPKYQKNPQNRSNIVTNSIKTLKMVHVKNKKKSKKEKRFYY